MSTYKITITITADADPSQLLDGAQVFAEEMADIYDGTCDIDEDVCVENVNA